ncbi:hypothetical protein O7606_06395 [Micromonospora sp. WMMD882]|uniref:hypothetical protein n=1 Tax=Micromonospora sp. WMMD882 TaxID=3015151 RepID=UPI00248AF29F|nr:hypothetical protein [Micromonospora sp. WMMD882]WBB81007.1 hypothetical protein O7606_06395 [Micromonospora sp. WMMD882]
MGELAWRLGDLAREQREQGIRPVGSIDELRGEPIEDLAAFLAALKAARGAGDRVSVCSLSSCPRNGQLDSLDEAQQVSGPGGRRAYP